MLADAHDFLGTMGNIVCPRSAIEVTCRYLECLQLVRSARVRYTDEQSILIVKLEKAMEVFSAGFFE